MSLLVAKLTFSRVTILAPLVLMPMIGKILIFSSSLIEVVGTVIVNVTVLNKWGVLRLMILMLGIASDICSDQSYFIDEFLSFKKFFIFN